MQAVPWGTSLALFYESERDLLDTCAGYFAAGLNANELCQWVLVESVTVEAARRALRSAVPDLARHEAAGGVILRAGDDLSVRGGAHDARWVADNWRDLLDRARERGYEGLRVSANAWGSASQWQQYCAFERELVGALSGQPIIALGTYDLGVSRAVEVLDVVRLHHLTIARRKGEWQFMETPELQEANARIRQLSDALTILSASFPGHELLTARERGVLAQIVKGDSSKEIARALGVSPRTVDFHRANIMHKLGVRNTAEIVRVVLSQR